LYVGSGPTAISRLKWIAGQQCPKIVNTLKAKRLMQEQSQLDLEEL
jgi:hypothetical protein